MVIQTKKMNNNLDNNLKTITRIKTFPRIRTEADKIKEEVDSSISTYLADDCSRCEFKSKQNRKMIMT
jgi:hypothetical protein